MRHGARPTGDAPPGGGLSPFRGPKGKEGLQARRKTIRKLHSVLTVVDGRVVHDLLGR